MAEFVDAEQRAAYLAALKREREFCVQNERPTVDVDAEIARVGGAPEKRTAESVQVKRAARRSG